MFLVTWTHAPWALRRLCWAGCLSALALGGCAGEGEDDRSFPDGGPAPDAGDSVTGPRSYRVVPLPSPSPDRPSCRAQDINRHGDVVGECCADALEVCDCEGVLWRGDVPETLDPPPGREGVTPAAVNDAGDIVGLSWVCEEENRAWGRFDGDSVDLAAQVPASIGRATRAMDLDEDGRWIAWTLSDGEAGGVLGAGGVTELGDLGGGMARPMGISDEGRVVGASADAEERTRAFVYDEGTGMRPLASPPSSAGDQANAINARGDVAGFYATEDGDQLAVAWIDGEPIPLDSPAEFPMATAVDIGAAGVAAGSDVVQNQDGYFVAVPLLWEASSGALLELSYENLGEVDFVPGNLFSLSAAGVLVGQSRLFTVGEASVARAMRLEPVDR